MSVYDVLKSEQSSRPDRCAGVNVLLEPDLQQAKRASKKLTAARKIFWSGLNKSRTTHRSS
jgi:hypothetical protein